MKKEYEVDLLYLIKLFFGKKIIILTFVTVLTLAVVIFSSYNTKTYFEVRSIIMCDRMDLLNFEKVIKNRYILNKAIQETGIAKNSDEIITNLTVEIQNEPSVVLMTYKDTSKEYAISFLDCLTNNAIEYANRVKAESVRLGHKAKCVNNYATGLSPKISAVLGIVGGFILTFSFVTGVSFFGYKKEK